MSVDKQKEEEARPTRPGEPADRDDAVNSLSDPRTTMSQDDDHDDEMMEHDIVTEKPTPADVVAKAEAKEEKKPKPNPSMMAPRRKLRSRYVPLPNEVWASAGFQTPFDVGQQYASWWYDHAATAEQRDSAHLLSGGGLPPEIDRPLLQFACETLHEYTLSETQRVNLRDGFHSGIRGVLVNINNRK